MSKKMYKKNLVSYCEKNKLRDVHYIMKNCSDDHVFDYVSKRYKFLVNEKLRFINHDMPS